MGLKTEFRCYVIKTALEKLLQRIESFGFKNKFVRFVLMSLVFIFNIYVDVLVYINFSLESHILLFTIWIISGLIGSYLIGWLSDISRKLALILSQFFGVIGLLILLFTGFNIWILCFLAIFYNPVTAARATFVHELHDQTFLKIMFTDPRIIAITQVLQAFPWLFYSLSESIYFKSSIEMLLVSQSLLLLLTLFFFSSSSRDQHSVLTKTANDKKSGRTFSMLIKTLINRTNGLPLLGFICAEMVYFLSAYYIIAAHVGSSQNAGKLFSVIAVGVFVGSTLHYFISHKWYQLSYRILTSSIYCLGGVLIGLFTLACWLFGAAQSIPIFIGTIAFFGAGYIPLVYSFLFQILHARHRGIASAIGEGAQGLASLLAAVLMWGLYFIPNAASLMPYIIGTTLAVLYFLAFSLSLGKNKHDQ